MTLKYLFDTFFRAQANMPGANVEYAHPEKI